MRVLRPLLTAMASCAVLAQALPAQTATGKHYLAGVNGAWSRYRSSTGTTWSVYTSPYKGRLSVTSPGSAVVPPSSLLPPAGVNAFGPVTDVFCVDFNHAASVGTTYNINYTNLGANAASIGTTTRAGRTVTDYLKAAYLSSQLKTVGVTTAAAGDINGAIWQIMSGVPQYRWDGSTWSATGINYWMSQAAANYGTINPYEWVVLTDVNAAGQGFQSGTAGSQEFITHVTPEPETLLLLGTGLALLLGTGFLRRSLA